MSLIFVGHLFIYKGLNRATGDTIQVRHLGNTTMNKTLSLMSRSYSSNKEETQFMQLYVLFSFIFMTFINKVSKVDPVK